LFADDNRRDRRHHPPVIRLVSIYLAFLIAACGDDNPALDAAADARATATTVYVVRHAETAGGGADPLLSVAGEQRSQNLATTLAPANISAIYTTEYHRTHDTATPTSLASSVTIDVRPIAGIDTAVYATDLATLIRSATPPQAVLIVGHSNTVPAIVMALSGTAITPIAESEYDRLYTITLADPVVVDTATY
jgi:broad specificity phosphatase PhoE